MTTTTPSNYYKFWEPHSSSIDFCETNYLHFDTIVEFHNTWSSLLGIASLGLIGAIWNNPTGEKRTVLAYSILGLIGVGSTGLHLSLHWIFQASDELPMLYMNNCISFMVFEVRAPFGKPKYPWLPYLFALITIIHTVVYYRFRDRYVIFFFVYAGGVFTLLYQGYNLILGRDKHKRGHVAWYFASRSVVTFCLVAFPVWVLDMHYCNFILDIVDNNNTAMDGLLLPLLRGITPHVLWHFCAAFGTYCAIACVVTCRMEELKIPFQLEYFMGIVPITVRINNDHDNNPQKKQL
ncbi:Alkaline ceramidase [Seminavis robusta]|uniref:Alkaline ceramidase n=1 Tax=Seminavis robusta TaxID=568900 RepID=A0A9N8HM48_9STRA|nr:Alkaline ceramidase [Seminavis robusta]|eukprot:Sro1084_g239440.1 Alkaline ceramidase (293) ;mRNA; r:4115-4993